MISIEEATRFYEGADSAHDMDHILRVTSMAEKLARAEGANVDVVRAAALLHDIARKEEDSSHGKIDHADQSARDAAALLRARGASDDFADRVAAAIRSHRFRGNREALTLEAQILFDADKLDAIGAIGVARACAVAGTLHQKLYSPLGGKGEANREQHQSSHSPVAEFEVKLSKLRDRFHTSAARALAESRHQFMVEFFRELEREATGIA